MKGDFMNLTSINLEQIDIQMLWNTVIIDWGTNLIFALLIFLVGKMIVKGITKLTTKLLERANVDAMLINFITAIVSAILLLFVVIAALSQLGIDTTSLVALVGAAGIAIGLALKDSLQNFASGVMLIVFKPFQVGHFVEAAGVMGTIESIGIFSTQMKTGDNKTLIIPNGNLYKGIIINYSAKPTRRVDMVFSIGYDDDIALAKSILMQLLEADERVLKDPEPVVNIAQLGASSIDFNVRPWVQSSNFWPVKWDMNEKVKQAFDAANIGIPYPQMDVHLHTESNSTLSSK